MILMPHTDTRKDCPGFSTLVDWLEGSLEGTEAEDVERHLDGCGICRQRALDWNERADPTATDTVAHAGCIDEELLVAYSSAAAALERSTVAHVEQHLRQCARCVGILQHFMRLERQLAPDATPAPHVAPATAEVVRRPASVARERRVIEAAAPWLQRLRDFLTPNVWSGAALAAAMALVLAIGVSRFASAPYDEMRVRDATQAATVEVISDTAGRPRPSLQEPIVVDLPRGTQARWLEGTEKWTRIELADGRRVRVESQAVAPVGTE